MALSKAMQERIAKAKAVGANMNEATAGGGDYTPPVEGPTRLRFVGYYELGTHVEQSGKFVGKKNKKVKLVFELSGKNHEPTEVDGKKHPILMTLEMNNSRNEKATLFKLFAVMNAAHGGEATTMPELLGTEYLGSIKHTHRGEGANRKTYANLENVRKAERMDEDDNLVPIKVDEPLTEIKMFVWDIATLEDWDSIKIEGEYPERKDKDGNVTRAAKSKNVFQDTIRAAVDFDSLPIYQLLKDGGVTAADERDMDDALGGADNDEPADDAAPFAEQEGEAKVDDLV